MQGITIEKIKKVSSAVESIGERAVFVGGAVAQFYVEPNETENIRFTKDVDLVFEILSFAQLERIRQKLSDAGFKQTIDNKVLCRFSFSDILVDVMSVSEIGWAPGNLWFKKGFSKAKAKKIGDFEILLLPLPYYLATKFSAFHDRGIADPYLSHDLEDIVYVLDNNPEFHNLLLIDDDEDVRIYLKENLKNLIYIPRLKEALIGHLPFYFQEKRLDRIEKNIRLYLESQNHHLHLAN